MKKVLIGHRGVGKTAFLKRHSTYFPQIAHFDLDEEIEKCYGTSIFELFKKTGEAEFRKHETEVFNSLMEKNENFVIALGAGFDISKLDTELEKLFIRRATDNEGRIFLNRPRLESNLSPLAEYEKRYYLREPLFLKYADAIYDMPEGISEPNALERTVVDRKFNIADAYYTLCEVELASIDSLRERYKNIELRTDLLQITTINSLLVNFPQHNWLVSIRSSDAGGLSAARFRDVDVNFYCEGCQILSSHADSIDLGISQLAQCSEKIHLKLCPLVENFSDLIKGYCWQQIDAESRSFLPRSKNASWKWYRQLAKYFQKINFLRNFTVSSDQPSISEWLILPEKRPQTWAAVLGQGIQASRSPLIHQSYFFERNSFFILISISTDELQRNFNFLIELGLTFAAITSPLKAAAYNLSDQRSETAEKLKSANTLFIDKSIIKCHNSDLDGFEKLASVIRPNETAAVWGGGGTLAMLKTVLPNAEFFSSQTGALRNGEKASKDFDYLVWAAPRMPKITWPDDLNISTLIDLNYSENSPGLEFATRHNIRYISGLEMLLLQAKKQQDFWSLNERK